MQHPKTDTGSSSPHRGEKEHTAFVHIPLMTRTKASHGLQILTSEGISVSYVQANGNGNMRSTQTG